MKTLLLASREQYAVDSVMVLLLKHNIKGEYHEKELRTKYYPTSSTQYWTNPKIVSENITVEFTGKGGLNVTDGLSKLNELLVILSNGQELPKDTLFDVVNKLSNGTATRFTREQKIEQRYNHDVKNGSTISLEQYQNHTSHSNLKQMWIDTEAVGL
jgi:hypothetical protein